MRLAFTAAAAAVMFSLSPAFAQTAAAPSPAPAPATPAPTMTAPQAAAPTMAAPKMAHKRQTLQERFDAANTTHDGHLTQAQAQAAKWTYLNKHFAVIDKDHKGYVTVDDIHGYAHAIHAAKHTVPAKPAAPATTTN